MSIEDYYDIVRNPDASDVEIERAFHSLNRNDQEFVLEMERTMLLDDEDWGVTS